MGGDVGDEDKDWVGGVGIKMTSALGQLGPATSVGVGTLIGVTGAGGGSGCAVALLLKVGRAIISTMGTG
jgi:hypothetical protein